MPDDPRHVVLTKQSKYIILSDILPVWEPSNGGIEVEGMASLGDAGLVLGSLMFEFGIILLSGYLIFVPSQKLWEFIRTKRKTVV
jgi:hypothetical protein